MFAVFSLSVLSIRLPKAEFRREDFAVHGAFLLALLTLCASDLLGLYNLFNSQILLFCCISFISSAPFLQTALKIKVISI